MKWLMEWGKKHAKIREEILRLFSLLKIQKVCLYPYLHDVPHDKEYMDKQTNYKQSYISYRVMMFDIFLINCDDLIRPDFPKYFPMY